MNSKVRDLIFNPLVSSDLTLLVPDLSIETSDGVITTPAKLTCPDKSRFELTLHFMQPEVPEVLRLGGARIIGPQDRLKITGQIEGDIRFSALALPPSSQTGSTRGTSSCTVSTDQLDLTAENLDLQSFAEIDQLLGTTSRLSESNELAFSAHLIFHGPKLYLIDSGTEIIRNNDFLGQSTSSSFDTHRFRGTGWEGALIQKGEELHLHLRDTGDSDTPVLDPVDLVDRVVNAVAFIHGFHPWPAYREIRINHRVVERWIRPRLNLKQSFLAPVSERMGYSARSQPTDSLFRIIPIIAEGFGKLSLEDRRRINILLWNVRSSSLGDLPCSTNLLVVCAAIDGLLRVIGSDCKNTPNLWREANNRLGFSWDKWTSKIYELRGRHRPELSHGRFWLPEESISESFFTDYPELGCAFMILIAAFCGYEGAIVAHPFKGREITIASLRI
jgi:hypothetical protein